MIYVDFTLLTLVVMAALLVPLFARRVTKKGRALAVIIVFMIPIGAGVTYANLGSPSLPGKPYASRAHDPDILMQGETQNLEAEMAARPDAEGYTHLGEIYTVLRMYDKAVMAYQKALRIDDQSSIAWSGFGEAMTLAQDGEITPEARDAFRKALQIDPRAAQARFYLGLSELQLGNPHQAIAIWRDLVRNAPPSAPWTLMVKKHIADVAQKAGLDPESIAPEPPDPTLTSDVPQVIQMNPEQSAAIHAMVDRLAVRLKSEPNDLAGWQRLARSYRVLGESDKAIEAEKKIHELEAKSDR